jgi:hypothetical protein
VLSIPVVHCTDFSFSPDLSELAVITGVEDALVLETFSVRDERPLERHQLAPDTWPTSSKDVVHLGEAVVHLEMDMSETPRRWRLVRHRDGVAEVLREFCEEHTVRLLPSPDGFVLGARHFFLFGGASGPVREVESTANNALHASDPATGRMAVVLSATDSSYSQRELQVLDAELRVVAGAPIEGEGSHVHAAWFCGSDTLVTYGQWHVLKSWRLDGESLADIGGKAFSKYDRRYLPHLLPLGITTLPISGLVVVESEDFKPHSWFDARTYAEVEAPEAIGSGFPVWVSPGEEYAAVYARHTLEIRRLR